MKDDTLTEIDQTAELRGLVAEARAGNLEVLPALREMLATRPRVWQHCADLGANVLHRWIQRISLGDPLAEESLLLKAQAMKTQFGGDNPSPLEQLLVDRIIVCWLQLQQADGLASQMDALPAKMGSLVLRRQKHAHRQFLTAVQTLAIVRRLRVGTAAR